MGVLRSANALPGFYLNRIKKLERLYRASRLLYTHKVLLKLQYSFKANIEDSASEFWRSVRQWKWDNGELDTCHFASQPPPLILRLGPQFPCRSPFFFVSVGRNQHPRDRHRLSHPMGNPTHRAGLDQDVNTVEAAWFNSGTVITVKENYCFCLLICLLTFCFTTFTKIN